MMRRALAGLLALTLLVGGAAACSDDDDGGDGDDTTTTAADGGGGESGATGNAEVDAYCAAVDAYVPIAQAAAAAPDDLELSQQATEAANGLAEPLAAVPDPTTLDPEVAAALEQCQITAAEAGLPPG